jgi:hypothetical protein
MGAATQGGKRVRVHWDWKAVDSTYCDKKPQNTCDDPDPMWISTKSRLSSRENVDIQRGGKGWGCVGVLRDGMVEIGCPEVFQNVFARFFVLEIMLLAQQQLPLMCYQIQHILMKAIHMCKELTTSCLLLLLKPPRLGEREREREREIAV